MKYDFLLDQIKKGFDDGVKQAQQQLDILTKRFDEISQENDRVKAETFKDETIKELQDRLEKLVEETQYGFNITKDEYENAQGWCRNHTKQKHGGFNGAGGGRYRWVFTPTGLGDYICVKCLCGDEILIRDII